jgi:arsenate reductase-like glutaredoxin family protein
MWKLKAIQVRGRLEKRDGEWDFVTTSFKPPSKLALLAFLKGTGTAAQKYLDKRGLARPEVNWVAVNEIKRRVKAKNG